VCFGCSMAAWAPLLALALVGLHVPCAAADNKGEESYTEAEWKTLQENILASFPDDDEDSPTKVHDEDMSNRGLPAMNAAGEKFPFLEYGGHLSERDADIHTGKMDLEAAKQWCVDNENCVAFTHIGDPTEEVVEYAFKGKWNLQTDDKHGETWTSYQKGQKMRDWAAEEEQETVEKEDAASEEFHCEIQADWEMIHMKYYNEIKVFVTGKGHLDAYAGLKFKEVHGKSPELVCFKLDKAVEHVDLTKGQSTEKLHVMVQDLGIKKRSWLRDEL